MKYKYEISPLIFIFLKFKNVQKFLAKLLFLLKVIIFVIGWCIIAAFFRSLFSFFFFSLKIDFV